jgi:hypothetical protein
MQFTSLRRLLFVITFAISMFPRMGSSKDLLPPKLAEEAEVTSKWIQSHFVSDVVRALPYGKARDEASSADWNMYWMKLRELGGKVGRETGVRLQNAKELTVEEEIALIAFEHAETPGRTEAIMALYSVPRARVPFDVFSRYLPGIFPNEVAYRGAIRDVPESAYRTQLAVPYYNVFPQHKTPEFRTAWEAVMIAPFADVTERLARRHTFKALEKIGNKQTAELALFRMQSISDSGLELQKKNATALAVQVNFAFWGTPEQVLEWSLRGLSIAEKGGFATNNSESGDFFRMLYLLLTFPGEYPSEMRYKVYIPAVRSYDLSKLPPSQQQVLKKAMATYDRK